MATKFYIRAGQIFKGNSEQPPKSAFDLERLLKWQLEVLNVPFNDDCCTASTSLPVAVEDGVIMVYDPDADDFAALDLSESLVQGTMIPAFYPDAAQNNIAAAAGGAISVATYLTTINTDAGGDAFTLADGTQLGQMKKILLVADGGGDGVVTPATAFAGGATTATFNDAGDYLILQWNGTAWRVLENSGVTVA